MPSSDKRLLFIDGLRGMDEQLAARLVSAFVVGAFVGAGAMYNFLVWFWKIKEPERETEDGWP